MIYGFDDFGYEGALVKVLADVKTGEGFDIVGLSDSMIKETKERCREALNIYHYDISTRKILVSLEPADTYKHSSFDVSIALAILGSEFREDIADPINVLVMGELELSGKIRPVKGTFGACQNALKEGIKYAILPEDSAVPSGIKVWFVKDIREAFCAYKQLTGGRDNRFQEVKKEVSDKIEFEYISTGEFNLDNLLTTSIMNEEKVNDYKFAMTVAVAGKHNLLVTGNGGLLRELPEILPKLDAEEQGVTNRIKNSRLGTISSIRPFRMPWHSITIEEMFGGGIHCNAGEISLAHNGVLFLDNVEDFRTSVLQMLRVPTTTGSITLSRAGRSTVYPADFQLMMATKPCPCGNYGVKNKVCLCSKISIERHWQKFTVGLLDGMDIRFDCNSDVSFTDIKMTLETMRELITNAWTMQKKRGEFNGKIKESITDEFYNWFEDKSDYKEIAKINGFFKKRFQIVMLARTLADMRCSEKITHVDYITAKKLRADTILDEVM